MNDKFKEYVYSDRLKPYLVYVNVGGEMGDWQRRNSLYLTVMAHCELDAIRKWAYHFGVTEKVNLLYNSYCGYISIKVDLLPEVKNVYNHHRMIAVPEPILEILNMFNSDLFNNKKVTSFNYDEIDFIKQLAQGTIKKFGSTIYNLFSKEEDSKSGTFTQEEFFNLIKNLNLRK